MNLYGVEKTDEEIKSHVINYYEEIKKSKNDRFYPIISLLEEKPNAQVLDYGCGWGHYAIFLRERGFKVHAIDYSKNEIDICRLVWGQQEGILFESRKINNLESGSYDYVLSSQVIEHVHNPGNYLSQINRVLKSQGKLVIALPNIMTPKLFAANMSKNMKSNLIRESENIVKNYDKAHHHINGWDPYHFVRLVSSVGFILEDYLPLEGVPVPYPINKFIKPYVYLKSRRLRNLSYVMAFRFAKIADHVVDQDS